MEGNVYLLGGATVVTPATPVLTGNSGAIASIARNGAGDYTITMDDDFRLEPDDVIDVQAIAAALGSAHVQNRAANGTTFDVITTDGANAAADAAFSVEIKRQLES